MILKYKINIFFRVVVITFRLSVKSADKNDFYAIGNDYQRELSFRSFSIVRGERLFLVDYGKPVANGDKHVFNPLILLNEVVEAQNPFGLRVVCGAVGHFAIP